MNFYEANLGIFVATAVCLLWYQHTSSREWQEVVESPHSPCLEGDEKVSKPNLHPRRFQLNFFVPYVLAVAADWLQGPHLYAIYKYEKGLAEKTVAALYATGFVSAGMSASFAGGLADRFGRKKACLLYCALYATTCLTMLSNDMLILFLGRFAGGICTTLLFSVFEAWMISDYDERGLHESVLELSSVFGTMTTLSGIAAIASGIVGDVLVQASGTRTWPFMVAIVCCIGAAFSISVGWRENVGVQSLEQNPNTSMTTTAKAAAGDAKMVTLGLIICVVEGTMYLFIFFWSAALKSSRIVSNTTEELPFGLIFSSFMCLMMAGSTLFTLIDRTPTIHSSVNTMLLVILLASCCQGLAVSLTKEKLVFWTFCLFECCIGIYFPTMACLKSKLVEHTNRAQVYGILRLPLNVFVVVAHSLDAEGDGHRNGVFGVCGLLLLVTYIWTALMLPHGSITSNASWIGRILAPCTLGR